MTEAQRQRVCNLAAKGFTVRDIAEVTGLDRKEVFRVAPRGLRRRMQMTLAETAEHLMSKVPDDRDPEEWRRIVRANFCDVVA